MTARLQCLISANSISSLTRSHPLSFGDSSERATSRVCLRACVSERERVWSIFARFHACPFASLSLESPEGKREKSWLSYYDRIHDDCLTLRLSFLLEATSHLPNLRVRYSQSQISNGSPLLLPVIHWLLILACDEWCRNFICSIKFLVCIFYEIFRMIFL